MSNATTVTSKYAHIINGEPVFSKVTSPVYNPATGNLIAYAPVADTQQLDDAIAAAQRAFPLWASWTFAQRAEKLMEVATIIENKATDYKEILTAEQGKPHRDAFIEIMGSVYWFRETSRFRLPETTHEDTLARKAVTRRVPFGVTATIVPWNFPILLTVAKIAPALLAGNTVIVKPSPWSPLTILQIIADIQSALPPGVLNVLNGNEELGSMITAHPGIKKISFTGSAETGKKVMYSASSNLKRVVLELGGNDPMIVLPCVNPVTITPHIFWGAFTNSGQFCVAAKRIYIHESVYESVRDALVSYAQTVVVGNGAHEGTQLGPVQNKMLYEKLRDLFEDCHTNGYEFAFGGDFPPSAGDKDNSTVNAAKPSGGLFVPITIVDNPPESSRIVQEEQFGPIIPLLKWKDEADVIQRANTTIYGLGASVWGEDLSQASRIASKMECGNVWINEIHTIVPTVPAGGHKQSGLGVENGVSGLMEWTNSQTISINKAGVTLM